MRYLYTNTGYWNRTPPPPAQIKPHLLLFKINMIQNIEKSVWVFAIIWMRELKISCKSQDSKSLASNLMQTLLKHFHCRISTTLKQLRWALHSPHPKAGKGPAFLSPMFWVLLYTFWRQIADPFQQAVIDLNCCWQQALANAEAGCVLLWST